MNGAFDVVVTLVYDAVSKREESFSVLGTANKGWDVIRLDNVVIVKNSYLIGGAMPLKPVWNIVKVESLHLIILIHGSILVP
jgi:hypothetical protein